MYGCEGVCRSLRNGSMATKTTMAAGQARRARGAFVIASNLVPPRRRRPVASSCQRFFPQLLHALPHAWAAYPFLSLPRTFPLRSIAADVWLTPASAPADSWSLLAIPGLQPSHPLTIPTSVWTGSLADL